jgi:cytochrome c-type biogenesis protein CcmE
VAIMNEHISNVDISDDVKRLKNQGRLPDTLDANALSELFRRSLAKMAIGIVADSVVVREIEENKIEEVLKNIKDDSDVIYLMGKADEKYYRRAEAMVQEGKLDVNSLAFRGLMAFVKQNEGWVKDALNEEGKKEKKKVRKSTPKKTEKKVATQNIDIHSDNIEL